jgi:MoxR-like ATPase
VPDCWGDFDDALRAGIDRIILYGPPGLGKTRAAMSAHVNEGGVFRLTCAPGMTTADVVGMWMPTETGAYRWHKGAVLAARHGNGSTGGRCVADEIEKASGDVSSTLLTMFDSAGSGGWMNPYTEQMEFPNPGFSVVMTTNLETMDLLPAALRDRFPVQIPCDVAHPNGLKALPEDLRSVAEVMTRANRPQRLTLRSFEAYAVMRRSLPLDQAARLAFGPALGVAEAIRIAQSAQNHS